MEGGEIGIGSAPSELSRSARRWRPRSRVRDLFDRIDTDGVEQGAVALWKASTDQDVDQLESVTEWLRR